MAAAEDFNQFWAAYPRRVGKLAARKAYDQVRRGGISQEELLDGIAQYVKAKPSWQEWCHPRTWLTQGRWLDEPDVVPETVSYGWTCPHTPHCPHRAACAVVAMRTRA